MINYEIHFRNAEIKMRSRASTYGKVGVICHIVDQFPKSKAFMIPYANTMPVALGLLSISKEFNPMRSFGKDLQF